LGGLFSSLVDNPLFSCKILNLIIGTMTVPVFYLLIGRVYDDATAFFSALILAFLPLHIDLSAGSLTEASLLFEIIGGTLALLLAAQETTKKQYLYIGLSLLCLSLAVLTRYEAWLLIPLFPAYYFLKTRRAGTAIFIMLVLIISPVAWMLGNYFHTKDLLPSFTANTKTGVISVGAHSVGLLVTFRILAGKAITHLGWIPLIAVVGAFVELIRSLKRDINLERTLHVWIAFVFWAFMVIFAMFRGTSLWDRYMLFGFVIALPFAASLLIRYFSSYTRRSIALIIGITIASVWVSFFTRYPQRYVTRTQPVEIKKLAGWLEKSAWRDDAILLTKMGWQSSYLPLYFPEVRYAIVSNWLEESRLQNFLRNQRPSLLITWPGDGEFQSRVEALLGWQIEDDRLVRRQGATKVYFIGSSDFRVTDHGATESAEKID
jgi:4-amino-4-deoxy-L-arabinose transferase-like glycosyltransferase